MIDVKDKIVVDMKKLSGKTLAKKTRDEVRGTVEVEVWEKLLFSFDQKVGAKVYEAVRAAKRADK